MASSFTPEARGDPLGGVIEITGSGFKPIQIVNFHNPLGARRTRIGEEAIRSAEADRIERSALRVVSLPYLIALKLYAEGAGTEPDTLGVGIVDGIIYGTDEVRNALGEMLQAIVFLRDNIFRAVQQADPDFSRNLEGQVLRLHWDPEELFYMVCKRIRVAFSIERESDVKVWNAITSGGLHGRDGFKRCLRLTLYRPRDVGALLNATIEQAKRQQRTVLVDADFNESSKQISAIRFDDLCKEYAHVFPGIANLTTAFANGPAQFLVSEAVTTIKGVLIDPSISADVLQHLRILGSEEEIVKALYGVGFLGVFDRQNGTWAFSHDGRRPDKTVRGDDSLMVHPCYWNTLTVTCRRTT